MAVPCPAGPGLAVGRSIRLSSSSCYTCLPTILWFSSGLPGPQGLPLTPSSKSHGALTQHAGPGTARYPPQLNPALCLLLPQRKLGSGCLKVKQVMGEAGGDFILHSSPI